MLRLVTIFFFITALAWGGEYSVRAVWGKASKNDFGQILSGQAAIHETGTGVVGMDGGWLWKKDFYDLPFDIYLKGGIYRFLDKGYYTDGLTTYVQENDFFEVVACIKGIWKFDFLGNRVRLGAAEGASYAWDIPIVEYIEAHQNNDYNSKFMNYLEVSLDFDVGRLVHVDALKDTYLGYVLKHRSGIYGLINSVHRGGSNYNLVAIEKNF